jgi:hypothetical protein
MAIKVEFDEKVSQKIGGAEGMAVDAASVHGALIQVARTYPALHMFNCEGELRSILKVQKNGQPATVRDDLNDGDMLRLLFG